MARLKVKQISDFTTKVQTLIDSDSDQSASLISANTTAATELAASVNSLEAIAGGSVTSDLTDSVSSLETLAEGNDTDITTVAAVAAQNDIDISTNASGIATNASAIAGNDSDISTNASGIATNASAISSNDTDITNLGNLTIYLGSSVNELQNSVSSLETLAGGLKTNVDAILSGSAADKDSFAEIVTLINSVDTANDNAFAGHVSNINASVDELQASVNSLEAVAGGSVTSDLTDSVSSLETLAEGNDTDIATNASGISTNASAISGNDSDISALQTKVTQLEGDSTYIHDYAAMAGAAQFRCSTAVEHASDDDMQVFINGHAIGRVRSVDGTKYGWEHNSNNTTFDLHNIGYSLEASDVIYVVSHS